MATMKSLLLLSLTALASCGPATTIHPTERNPVPDGFAASAITRTESTAGQTELNTFKDKLENIRESWTVGSSATSGLDSFGRIEDVAADAEGRVFVLDSRLNEIRVYHGRGVIEQRFGRLERGMSEFRSPSGIEARSDGSLVVADRGNRLRLFTRKGREYSRSKSLQVDFVPEKMCLLGDRIFVRGWVEEGQTIHEISPEGQTVLSFGGEYEDDSRLVREQLSDGVLACNEEAGVIVAAMEFFPWIYGYSPDGALQWMSRLEEFSQMDIAAGMENGKAFVRYSIGVLPNEVIASIEAIEGKILLQTRLSEKEGEEGRTETIHSYAIDAETGRGLYLGSSLPLVKDVRLPFLYSAQNEPYPALVVYETEEQ